MPPQPSFQQQRTAARGAARTRARATLARRTAGVTPEGAAVTAADVGARAARDAARARIPTGDRQYQGVILAEFLVAVLIVGVAPLARGKAAQDVTGGPSPYGPDDVKQLAALGAVYFVLALLSSGKHGRMAAWFGGLVLVAIGLSETTSGGLPAIFGIFQPASQSAGPSGNAGGVQGAAQATIEAGQDIAGAGGPLPVPGGSPSFTQQVTQAGATTTVYQGGPGVITTDTGTQLA